MVLSIVDEDRELAMRKVFCETHKRILRPHQQVEQAQTEEYDRRNVICVLTRSRPTRGQWWRSLIRAFPFSLSRPDARQHSFWGMWCILVFHRHLTIILCCGHMHAGWNTKQVLSSSCIFGYFGVRNCFYLVIALSVEQCHDTTTFGTYHPDLRNCDNSCSGCIGEHTAVSRYCRFCARLGDGRSTRTNWSSTTLAWQCARETSRWPRMLTPIVDATVLGHVEGLPNGPCPLAQENGTSKCDLDESWDTVGGGTNRKAARRHQQCQRC